MINQNEKIIIKGYEHVAFQQDFEYSKEEMIQRSEDFYTWLDKRRSIRMLSDKPVPKEVIQNLILAASTAPSGAHKQPWTFCAVSNPELKRKIRIAAEKEEEISYTSRMSERWKKDLAPLATDMYKPFLETAPWLIIAFKQAFEFDEDGEKHTNYYVNESVGISCGMLITAIHNAGLVTLTHTPSAMNFLAKLLDRPKNERAYILFPIGYAADTVYVPNIQRKSLDEVCTFHE